MPNEIPGNAGFLTYTNLYPITAGVGVPPTTLGRGMLPNTAVPLIDGSIWTARGTGVWDLDAVHVPPLDPRFPRGSRLTGVRGTVDIWMTLGADGTARTVCYLTDNPTVPTNVIGVRIDAQNRALLTMTQGVIAPVAATGTLDMTGGNATNTEDVTIDTKTYTFEASLTNVDGNVQIGATTAETIANLVAAITLGAGAGTKYALATTLHPTVTAAPGATDTMDVTAKQLGTVGNAIASTENLLNGNWTQGATLTGGADGDITTVGEVSPTGPPTMPVVAPGAGAHVRLAWDSENRIPGTSRHMSFSYNGEQIAAGNWGTDPLTGWASWQPTHLVLGAGLTALALEEDFNGVIRAVQVSNIVSP